MSNKSFKISRTAVSIFLTLVLMPIAVLAIALLYKEVGSKSYYIGSVVMIIISMIPFFVSFEGRRPDARELVVIAVLCAIAVVSRAAFIAVPHFKPVIAIIIIAGVNFGPQAGFFTGALTAFVSNFFFGQGPWTPWQMFAFGISGFIAGLLAKKGILDGKKPLRLCIVSAITVMCIVGPVLDTSTVFMTIAMPTAGTLGSIYLAGLPVNAVLAVATVVTLLLVSKPMTEKLERIKVKYGMMEGQI